MIYKQKLLTIAALSLAIITGIGIGISPTVYGVAGRNERVERVTERRCTIAQARLGAAKTRFENVKERRVNKYTKLAERLDSAITRAEGAGYDVSELKAARTAVQSDIADYKVQAKELYDALTSTEKSSCEESEAPYANTLGKARVELRDTRRASLKVHQTFRERVVPELKQLADWAKERQ